jgi:glyoxylase-like metal-dependent hydrolase (beta-lactamase superfamily II)
MTQHRQRDRGRARLENGGGSPCKHADSPEDRLLFEQVSIGNKRNFAYIVGDRRDSVVAVVDVGFKADLILEMVHALGAKVQWILATHSHRDHMGAAPVLKERTGAPLAAYKTITCADVPLDHGDTLQVGCIRIEVIHTPGHSPDSICFLIDGRKLITGDTLYVGRAPKAPRASLMRPFFDSLHNRLMQMDDAIEVWPGHDVGVKPHSTIGEERRQNVILNMTFEDFCSRRWDRVKKRWVVPPVAGSRGEDQCNLLATD